MERNLISNRIKKEENTSPPYSGFIFYWIAIITLPFLMSLDNYWYLLALVPMIAIHHGTHEAVHGVLSPKFKFQKKLNYFSGCVGFALLGQNFIFMRWSHMGHHRYGRLKKEFTIDGAANTGKISSKIWYYFCLAGASNIYHEIAGYLYPLLGEKYHILSRRFKPRYYHNKNYIIIQVGVLIVTVFLFYTSGIKLIICKLLFTLYWGAFQNVAHYGLEIGQDKNSRYASRTYRLPKFYELFIFRSGAYHLEHHVFPHISGYKLSNKEIQERIEQKIGLKVKPEYGLIKYFKDCFSQYKGPENSNPNLKTWSVNESTDLSTHFENLKTDYIK